LRLLELPAAWSSFTDENPDGASCLGPTSALKSGQERYHTVVKRLRDASLTSFYVVARADKASLKEASRTSNELKELGMSNQLLYINGVFKALDKNDLLAQKIEAMGNVQLNAIPDNLKVLPLKTFPLLPYNVLGIVKLRSLFNTGLQKSISENNLLKSESSIQVLKGIDQLVDELCANQQHGLIMTMGKGGVGKTIAASAIAVLLAKKGFDVLLTTTDPAAHIQDFIEQLGELPSTLTVERIDPKVETQRYTHDIMRHNIKAGRLRTPYMSLQDQTLSKIILVSLPETTPMREAVDLQNDLLRAGIRPYAWLINQSLSMLSGISDPLLKSRANAEIQVIKTIKTEYADKTFGIPFIAENKLLPALLNKHLSEVII